MTLIWAEFSWQKYKHKYLQYATEWPGIDFIAVAFLAENLRRNVVWSATQSPTNTKYSLLQ